MAKIRKVPESETEWRLQIMCPGCNQLHSLYTHEGRPKSTEWWTFNGNYDLPTLHPSLLVWHNKPDGSRQTDCHSFVKDGMIQFLGDCAHDLKGTTVELPNVE